jgi:hypothetical protein
MQQANPFFAFAVHDLESLQYTKGMMVHIRRKLSNALADKVNTHVFNMPYPATYQDSDKELVNDLLNAVSEWADFRVNSLHTRTYLDNSFMEVINTS